MRCQRVFDNTVLSALLCATLFGALHYPNLGLMLGTYAMSAIWVYVYLRCRSLWPIIPAHIVLGVLFLFAMPEWLIMSPDVGAQYYEWMHR